MNRGAMTAHILDRLEREGDAVRRRWNAPGAGTTTRHAVIDDLLPDETALAIFAAFPRDGDGFHSRRSFREHKRTSANLDSYPPILTHITFAIQDPRMIARIGEITGLDALEPDASLYAGGLSMMFRGEFLNPHIDNSHEATKRKYRRINLLYYVTPDWKVEDGGNLELWDERILTPVVIHSRFNRLALMETNETTWHSVSPVVADGARCCVSNYYFSDISPSGEDYYHVTSFTGRPEQKARRAIAALDNSARTFARQTLGLRRYRKEVYAGSAAEEEG